MKLSHSLAALIILISQVALAHPNHEAPPMPKEFDTLKGLVGTWEGKAKMGGDKEELVKVVYELTSGGTAIVEKLMPGTPNEMVTVYHKDGKTLGMTHYCALGNQPHMMLKKADASTMVFEMTKVQGISSIKEPHMHAVTLTMPDKDTLNQEWTHFSDGKKSMTVHLSFKRKK